MAFIRQRLFYLATLTINLFILLILNEIEAFHPHHTRSIKRFDVLSTQQKTAADGIQPSSVLTANSEHRKIMRRQNYALEMAVKTPPREVQIPISEQNWKIVPDIWETLAGIIPDKSMLVDPIHGEKPVDFTFLQVNDMITNGAAALQKAGIIPGDCVSVFSENSHRWFVMEQAIMKAGGCNAVRGAMAPTAELQFIYDNSRSVGAVIENPNLLQQLYKSESGASTGLKSDSGLPKFIVILYSRGMSSKELCELIGSPPGVNVMTYEDLMASSDKFSYNQVVRDTESTATLVYTSGTTSKPKGVLLKHRNLLHQVFANAFNRNNGRKYDPWVGDVFVSILPCWHIFERTAEYFCLSRGAQMVYSNLRNFKSDLTTWKPHFLIAVPRLFESLHKTIQQTMKNQPPSKRKIAAFFTAVTKLYVQSKRTWQNLLVRDKKPNIVEKLFSGIVALAMWPLFKIADTLIWKKIRENFGGRVKIMISGGSSIANHIESFFDMSGLRIIVGYGLTETSPVIANRLAEHNVMGTVGLPPPGTELKIVDLETRKELPVGKSGLLLARGPGVMSGYMRNPEATSKAIDKDNFFDTGDLARINPSTGDFIITGRAKDTIVLSNGENVEPQSIEESILAATPLVDQVMLLGQDETYLSALVVVNVPELVRLGLIDKEKGKSLDAVLGPTALTAGPQGDVEILRTEGELLNENSAVRDAIMADINKVCEKLRPWERVATVRILLEPFSAANGQLTQTLKVKKHQVMEAYASAIEKIYSKKGK